MGRIVSAFLVGIFFIIAGIYLLKSEENLEIKSPAAKIFKKTEIVEPDNSWFPEKVENKDSRDIYISGKSALIVDYGSGEVLFAKNANTRLPAASTIKIMAALIALENSNLEKEFIVSQNAARVGEDSMYLSEGETVTLEQLLYGMMLVSGNDAAITIAEGIAGTEEAYVSLMNEKATKLGLSNTLFANATGLDEDGKNQYSTVGDLVTIAHYTWENFEEFRKIVSTPEIYIEASKNHKDFMLYNDTNLLTSYPGVRGIKPGFTWNARYCLVTYVENDGKKLIGVILGSEDRRGEMVLLLDHGFSKFGISVNHPGLDLQI